VIGANGCHRSGLPYDIVAGIEPVPGGWLVCPGNLQGVNLAPQSAVVQSTLAEVLDQRPAFEIIALHAPIGVPDRPSDWRECDLAARRVLGPRSGAALKAPSRDVLSAESFEEARRIDPSLDIVRWRAMAKAAEAVREVQSWRQRNVWEVNPELAFTQMNDGKPLGFGRRSQLGRRLRRELLLASLPGSDRVLAGRPRGLPEEKLLDALADLWTARRIAARAITRMADNPTWDGEGVRMDIVC
jgi:predicted RNase H-like nuclease